MSAALTEEEKVKIRHYTGNLNVAEAASFVLGVPAGVQTQQMIELGMNKILVSALPLCRQILSRLDYCEAQMLEGIEAIQVTELGGLKPNVTGPHRQQVEVRRAYDWYVGELCNLLGVERNPFDKRSFGRKLNVRVNG